MSSKQFAGFSANALSVFQKAVTDYHVLDTVDQPLQNPFEPNSLEGLLYKKKLD